MPRLLAALLKWAQTCHAQGMVFGTTVEVSICDSAAVQAAQLGARAMTDFKRRHHKFHEWQPSALTARRLGLREAMPIDASGNVFKTPALRAR